MDSDWILGKVKSRSLRCVAAWAVVGVAVLLLVSGQRRYFRNFFGGPYNLGAAELDAIQDPAQAPRYFVKVAGSDVAETGLEQITIHKSHGVETSRSVSASYYMLAVGDKFLVCKSGSRSTTFQGELEPISADLAGRLFSDPEMQAIRDRFYPYYLNDDSFRTGGYVAIVGLLILGLVFFRTAIPAWRHLGDPWSHPLVKRIHGWGDPMLVATAEREAASPRHKGRNGWSLTEQFLVRSTFFRFDLLRLSDIVWAYKKVTQHRTNFVPTGKTYEAIVVCYGGAATITGKEATVDTILTYAAQRAPWAIFGFDKELDSRWRKDSSSVCAAVEKRRQEWAQRAQQA